MATLLEAYKNDIVENKNKQSMNADKFLTQRIMLIGNDLNSTENRMASFKQTNDVIDFDKNASIYLDQSNQANQQVMKLESEKNDLEGLRYSRIIIATDADNDGFHIRNLMLTFFLGYFEELVTSGRVFILETPLFRVRTKTETKYCYSERCTGQKGFA